MSLLCSDFCFTEFFKDLIAKNNLYMTIKSKSSYKADFYIYLLGGR